MKNSSLNIYLQRQDENFLLIAFFIIYFFLVYLYIHSSNPFQGEYTKKIKKSFIDWFALSVHVGKYPLSASST